MTTAQFFALWRALAELAASPAAGLELASWDETGWLPPVLVAAYHARDYRDALGRMARYTRLCLPEELRISETEAECTIESRWLYASDEEPSLLTDATFASLLELGRRGTQMPIFARRLELRQAAGGTRMHEDYFGGHVQFLAKKNLLVLAVTDLDRPFVGQDRELLGASTPEQVKWTLKRLLPGGQHDIVAVAQELGVSERTLQRRITEYGGSFRELLQQARQELARYYLGEASLAISEVAYLLGYGDPNSFYRAFRAWEGTAPGEWRASFR